MRSLGECSMCLCLCEFSSKKVQRPCQASPDKRRPLFNGSSSLTVEVIKIKDIRLQKYRVRYIKLFANHTPARTDHHSRRIKQIKVFAERRISGARQDYSIYRKNFPVIVKKSFCLWFWNLQIIALKKFLSPSPRTDSLDSKP